MKIAVRLARNRRLLAWCALSLLLHLLTFAGVDAWTAGPVAPTVASPLAVRLTGAPPPPRSRPAPRDAADSVQAPAPAPAAAPAQAASSSPPRSPARSTDAGPDPEALPSAEAQEDGGMPSMPGTYQVQPPPSTRLRYAVTRTRPGAPDEVLAPAQLVWERKDFRYQLIVDGVLGELESEGGDDDAGVAPERARERSPTGGHYTTRFDRDGMRIDYPGGSVRLPAGAQDRASVLMQLAGIGLAQPNQVQETIDIVVGSPAGAQIARFGVMGEEKLVTGAGRLATVRLAQRARAGERRVELWLAPRHNWMPVQLRVTEPDGSYATQVVTSIETEAAPLPGA